ncbi:MAG TPA: hypothetical protein VGM14_30270 [Streptosporangiaceae bacterium]
MTLWGTVTIKLEVTTEFGSGESIVTLTLPKDLDGETEISLPGGASATIPINLVTVAKSAASEGVDWKGATWNAPSQKVIIDGVPYDISQKFGPLSLELDLSTEGTIPLGGDHELSGVSISASIKFERIPNVRAPPPPGGPLGYLNPAVNRAPAYVPATVSPIPSYSAPDYAGAAGAAGAAAILAALFGAMYRSLFGGGSSKPVSPSLGLTPAR